MSGERNISLTGAAFIGLVVSYGLLFVAALWLGYLDEDWFWRLSLTYGVVIVVLAAVYLVRREFIADRTMQDKKYMD